MARFNSSRASVSPLSTASTMQWAMWSKDHLARIVNGRLDRRKLNQHLAAIPTALHHALDGFQMADGPGNPVQNSFRILMSMGMGMLVAVLHHRTVVQYMCVLFF